MDTQQTVGDPAVEPVAGAAAGGILLRLGSSRYAVGMADVAEVAGVPALTRIPGTPGWLSGVANWRGRILPVLDLRLLLATPVVPLATSARLVVLTRGDVVVGVLAEAVPGVHDGTLDDATPAPATVTGDAGSLVCGQLTDRHGPFAVLDVGAVLALRDRVGRRRHG